MNLEEDHFWRWSGEENPKEYIGKCTKHMWIYGLPQGTINLRPDIIKNNKERVLYCKNCNALRIIEA